MDEEIYNRQDSRFGSFVSGYGSYMKVVGIFIVLVVMALILRTLFATSLTLKRVTPESNSVLPASIVEVVFEFNKPIASDDFSVRVTPDANYTFVTNAETVSVTLSGFRVEDNATYLVSLENVVSEDGDVLAVASTSFTLDVSDTALDYVGKLPSVNDTYIVSLYSDRYIIVTVTGSSYETHVTAARNELVNSHIDPAVYRVVFEPDYNSLEISPSEQLYPPGE